MAPDADSPVTVGGSRIKIDFIARDLGQLTAARRCVPQLVVAGAGGGKTHALAAIVAKLCGRRSGMLVLRPAMLGVGSYADMLYESLRSHDPDLADRSRRAASGWLTIENLITDLVTTRPTVLVLDDVDRTFSRIEPFAHSRLRGWIDHVPNLRLVASAETTMNTASRSRRPWPWRTIFAVTDLPQFGVDDSAELVRAEAERVGRDGRIDELAQPWRRREVSDLYAQLGGNPRVWAITAAHLARTDSIDAPLPAILDQLAPYYLPRLHALSPLSSRLVVALARAVGAPNVTTLAARVGLSHQNTAAALSRLVSTNWLIRQKPVRGADQRKRHYAIADPAMRTFLRDRDDRHSHH